MEPGKLIIKIAALLFILVQLSAYTMADRSAGDRSEERRVGKECRL